MKYSTFSHRFIHIDSFLSDTVPPSPPLAPLAPSFLLSVRLLLSVPLWAEVEEGQGTVRGGRSSTKAPLCSKSQTCTMPRSSGSGTDHTLLYILFMTACSGIFHKTPSNIILYFCSDLFNKYSMVVGAGNTYKALHLINLIPYHFINLFLSHIP